MSELLAGVKTLDVIADSNAQFSPKSELRKTTYAILVIDPFNFANPYYRKCTGIQR
jgi:hypothetical protein